MANCQKWLEFEHWERQKSCRGKWNSGAGKMALFDSNQLPAAGVWHVWVTPVTPI
jgi:hypothetical protein